MNANQLASVLAVGAVFNVVYPIGTAIDEAAEYEQCAYCYAGGFSSTPAPAPTPAATASDDHSWFAVAPSLLSLPARYPVTGRWTDELPPLQAFFRVEVDALPVVVAIPELPARVVEVPTVRAKPARVLGVWRDTLPGIVASFTGNIEDPDEPLYLMVAELMSRPEPRNYLVDRRVIEDEWLAIVAGLLSK